MSKYGFGIDLPPAAAPPRPHVAPEALENALVAGAALGFAPRTPRAPEVKMIAAGTPDAEPRQRPGPRRTEAQDKVSIPGPARVVAAFRDYCRAQDLTLWQGLERLLEGRAKP